MRVSAACSTCQYSSILAGSEISAHLVCPLVLPNLHRHVSFTTMPCAYDLTARTVPHCSSGTIEGSASWKGSYLLSQDKDVRIPRHLLVHCRIKCISDGHLL